MSTTSAKGVVWIVVRGEVDLANGEQLRTSLAAIELGRARLVYLDLRLLGFCDSAGCRILLRFEEQATGGLRRPDPPGTPYRAQGHVYRQRSHRRLGRAQPVVHRWDAASGLAVRPNRAVLWGYVIACSGVAL